MAGEERLSGQSTRSSPSKVTKSKLGCCDNVTYHISNGLGKIFYRLGFKVATNPWNTIIISCLLVMCCSFGMLFFYNEKNPLKLWIPQDSRFIHDTKWIMNTVQVGYRQQSVLISAPDVLQPHVLLDLARISREVEQFKVRLNNGSTIGWPDICFKIPIIADLPEDPSKRKKTAESTSAAPSLLDTLLSAGRNRPFNPSVDMMPLLFCSIIDNLPLGCMSQNLLELWKFDEVRIEALSKDDILRAINHTTVSPTTGHDTDFVQLLGDIRRNSTGHIVAASSLLTHWMVYVNFTEVDHSKIGNAAGTEDWASEEALSWENGWLHKMDELHPSVSSGINGTSMFYSAGRSFGDISSATMFQDMDKLILGGVLMFVYMEIVLSKFGWTEIRMLFGGLGLLSVGMAFVSAIGLCSMLGVPYGPVHTSLPFLLMGLGVDDIFVMMSCWRQVESMNTGCSIPEKMGLMMKHAGSSITVTSITDVVAFLIGASTILPSLESFCIYAGVGVFIMYLLVITFAVAILTLDERRIEQNRNSFAPCIVHSSEESTKLWCNPNLMHRSLKFVFQNIILTSLGKILVIIAVIMLAAFSMQGLLRLEQKFDPSWFIPQRTYLSKYLHQQAEFYPDIGHEATMFLGALNYTAELPKIWDAMNQIENRTQLVQDVNAWIEPFRHFVSVYYEKDITSETLTDLEWREYLSKFLFSSSGGKFQSNFIFDSLLECGKPTGNVTVSSMSFRYRRFEKRFDYVTAMHSIERIVDDMHFASGDRFATVWGKIYGNWITDEVIDTEVLRNIILALVCVMACTLVLIANLQMCFFIFVCVLLTLINVCGFMQRWGLTIDLVSCIGLELAVGLCVDYAAHVGHTFLTIADGDRNERTLETILHIGAAVLYGGGSTLLALAMLANSEAYTFNAFFKIFLLVIVFGLFHGVVFLPVVLSLIGPAPYVTTDSPDKERMKAMDEEETISFVQLRPSTTAKTTTSLSTVDEESRGLNEGVRKSASQNASVLTENDDLDAIELCLKGDQ